jgi:hypothetical protein
MSKLDSLGSQVNVPEEYICFSKESNLAIQIQCALHMEKRRCNLQFLAGKEMIEQLYDLLS